MSQQPAEVIGNTVTINEVNGLCVGSTKAGGVWIAIPGGSHIAERIAELINGAFPDEEIEAEAR